MERFAGRVAVVTGASSGVGAQVAADLVRAGLVVVGVARREDRLTALAASLEGEAGKLHAVPADLSVVEEVQRVYAWVDANLGGVSVVVNCAALLTVDSIVAVDAMVLQKMVTTNLTAVMVCCQEALRSMQKHDIADGHIVNINSVAGHVVPYSPASPSYSFGGYAATKFGVRALCRGLRYDVLNAEGLKTRITSVSPGGVDTEMLNVVLPGGLEASGLPPGAVLKAKDVSDAVLFVLSCPPLVEITELTLQATGEIL